MAPLPPPYKTSDAASLAFSTARLRWPVIITGAIDDMYRSVAQCDDTSEKKEEGKRVVEELARLKYELQHNREMTPIPDDGLPDVETYNSELRRRRSPGWMDVDWLYSECYLYRRIHSHFARSRHWRDYDVFARQKIQTFRSSRPAVAELAARYRELATQIRDAESESEAKDVEKERLLFIEMCEICLWGNATDLSLLTTLTYDDLQKLQGSDARRASEQNIVVNDLPAAFELLTRPGRRGRVDLVLDNSGFELFVDLVLAGYLLTAGLATTVVLHPKSMPWFVSDVIPADFAALLGAMAGPKPFYETPSEEERLRGHAPAPLDGRDEENILFLFDQWRGMHSAGKLVLRPNEYWTLPGPFWDMASDAAGLAADLATSDLVIFKGDLNYRKLTADLQWDPTTPFETAIQALGPGSGLNILSLRTCKADVVVGLQPGDDDRIRRLHGQGEAEADAEGEAEGGAIGARKWAWTGKWAIASLSLGGGRPSRLVRAESTRARGAGGGD